MTADAGGLTVDHQLKRFAKRSPLLELIQHLAEIEEKDSNGGSPDGSTQDYRYFFKSALQMYDPRKGLHPGLLMWWLARSGYSFCYFEDDQKVFTYKSNNRWKDVINGSYYSIPTIKENWSFDIAGNLKPYDFIVGVTSLLGALKGAGPNQVKFNDENLLEGCPPIRIALVRGGEQPGDTAELSLVILSTSGKFAEDWEPPMRNHGSSQGNLGWALSRLAEAVNVERLDRIRLDRQSVEIKEVKNRFAVVYAKMLGSRSREAFFIRLRGSKNS